MYRFVCKITLFLLITLIVSCSMCNCNNICTVGIVKCSPKCGPLFIFHYMEVHHLHLLLVVYLYDILWFHNRNIFRTITTEI